LKRVEVIHDIERVVGVVGRVIQVERKPAGVTGSAGDWFDLEALQNIDQTAFDFEDPQMI
jgi:hypothetical protein